MVNVLRRKVGEVMASPPVLWPLALITAVLVAAIAPALVVAGATIAGAWWMGWPASRLRNVVVVVALGVAATMLVTWNWAAPLLAWWDGVNQLVEWDMRGLVAIAPLEVLVGVVLGWISWWKWQDPAKQAFRQQSGEISARRARDRRTRAATTRALRLETPRAVGDQVVLGQQIAVDRPNFRSVAEVLGQRHPYLTKESLRTLGRHFSVIGQTGVGKTVFLRELSLSWTVAAWRRYELGTSATGATHKGRPLTIMVDLKGGAGTVPDAEAWRDSMISLGLDPRRVGLWPYECKLDMWNMPADQLRESLAALGRTDHQFYDAMQRSLLGLIVGGRSGPPRDSVEFLRRMDRIWLIREWDHDPGRMAEVFSIIGGDPNDPKSSSLGTLDTDRLLFRELFDRLAGDFDAGQRLNDFDALYVSLPGARSPGLAAARFRVLQEVLLTELERNAGSRPVLFIIDEFSAIASHTDVELYGLTERARSANATVGASAQSFQGLGPNDDARSRLLDGQGGGLFVMRTGSAEELSFRAGTRRVMEFGKRYSGGSKGGLSKVFGNLDAEQPQQEELASARTQHATLLDPNDIRNMPDYQCALVRPGMVEHFRVPMRSAQEVRRSRLIVKHPGRMLTPAGDRVPTHVLTDQRAELISRYYYGGNGGRRALQ